MKIPPILLNIGTGVPFLGVEPPFEITSRANKKAAVYDGSLHVFPYFLNSI